MFMVSTLVGLVFECTELGDAVSLADALAKDLEEDAVVVDEDSCEVVYTVRN